MSNKSVEFNYNSRMPYESRLRIQIELPITFLDETKLFNRMVTKRINFLVDTGATHTIIPAYWLGFKDKNAFKKAYSIDFGDTATGIEESIRVEFFPLWIEKIGIGDIELKQPIISVSFDPGFKTGLLGMDILGLFKIEIDPEIRILKLTESDRLQSFGNGNISINEPSLIDPRKVPPKFNRLDLEANYINGLIKGD